MDYRIRLLPEAEADLSAIYDYIRDRASQGIAQGYVQRIMTYLAGFDTFLERGTRRDDIRPGLRIVGFERRVTIGVVVEDDEVVVSNVLYGGRELPDETGG